MLLTWTSPATYIIFSVMGILAAALIHLAWYENRLKREKREKRRAAARRAKPSVGG